MESDGGLYLERETSDGVLEEPLDEQLIAHLKLLGVSDKFGGVVAVLDTSKEVSDNVFRSVKCVNRIKYGVTMCKTKHFTVTYCKIFL